MSVQQSILPGVVARLASGGPKMTVLSVIEGSVSCAWFSGETLKQQAFPVCSLRRFDEIAKIELVGVSAEKSAGDAS